MSALLEPVGLTEQDSQVYLQVLSSARATAAGLAETLRQPVAKVRRSLRQLTDAGLVSRVVGTPPRYAAVPPEVALDALVTRRHQALDELRAQARELSHRATATVPGGPADILELIEGNEALVRTLAQLELGAREEILAVDCPPYMADPVPLNTNELRMLERGGVAFRAVYDATELTRPGRWEQVERYIAAGEQARVLPATTMKMIIVDRRMGLLPLSFDAADGNIRLLVHPSPVLDAMLLCFETLWGRATPLAPGTAAPAGEISAKDRRILSMLATGMKDSAIARATGVTERTVGRRVSELMRVLETETRFQAGVQAARRGWL